MKKVTIVLTTAMSLLLSCESLRQEEDSHDDEVFPTSIILDNHELNLEIGQSVILTLSIEPKGAIIKDLVWESSDETIVSVSQTGGWLDWWHIKTIRCFRMLFAKGTACSK